MTQTIAVLIGVLFSPNVRTILILSSFVIIVLLAAGCGGRGDAANDGSKQVVAAFYPLAFAAERVAGRDATVTNLTPPGVEPHDVELSARDVERIGDADLVLYLGAGFQPALERAVEATGANAVDVLDGLSLRPGDESEFDPHVWLDPIRFEAVAERIATELGKPEEGRQLVAELERLDAEYAAGLRTCERRELVTSHAAFGYLADRYGLEQVAITGLSPEAEPTPGELHDVVEEVRKRGATTVFFETLVSPRLAKTVATEVGAESAVLNPLEGLTQEELDRDADYFSIMRDNLASLEQALGCR
jgi:zinc transport system substrate-binding protein